jgi:TPR repeat protein
MFVGPGMPLDVWIEHLRRGAEAGEAKAQYDYARLLEIGDAVPRDQSRAAHYYKLAADQGHAFA